MKAAHTLKNNGDFRRLYSRGKSCVNGYMVVYCRRNCLGRSRIGYTVSAKLGGAVVRNRARRRLREMYRLCAPSLCEGYDIVIVARHRCLEAEFQKLCAAFLRSCGELGMIKGDGQ